MIRIVRRSLLCFIILFAPIAKAATTPIPGPADPGRIEKNIQPLQEPEIKKPDVQYKIKKEDLGDDKELPHFKLDELKVTGVTVYTDEELKEIYGKYLGQEITQKTLVEIAGDITQKYYSDGYVVVIVSVPQQDIKDGVATIKVVEGYVGRLREEGKRQDSDIVASILAYIKDLKPFNAKKLENYMLNLKALSGLDASATLEPINDRPAQPGEIGVLVSFKEDHLPQTFSVDNWGSRFVGAVEESANLGVSSVLQPYDSLRLTFFGAAPTHELKYFGLTSTEPLTSDGLTLITSVNRSRSEPGFSLAKLDLISNSSSIDLQLQYPLLRSRSEELLVGIEAGHKNVNSTQLGTEIYHDKYSALRIPINYNKTDNWDGSNNVNLLLSKGVDIFDVNETGADDLSRKEGHTDFTKIEAKISRLQQVDDDFQLFGSLSGQYAWDPLLSSEEFGYGGQEFGRGYDPSEITGDSGIDESLEIRYNGLPPVSDFRAQLFAFYDAGQVWNIDPGSEDKMTASSAGGGTRLNLGDTGTSLVLTAAKPLTLKAANPDYGSGKNIQYFFNLNQQF